MTTIISAVYEDRVELLADGGGWRGRDLVERVDKIFVHPCLPMAIMVRGYNESAHQLGSDFQALPSHSVDAAMDV
jgi:hypothetical protein